MTATKGMLNVENEPKCAATKIAKRPCRSKIDEIEVKLTYLTLTLKLLAMAESKMPERLPGHPSGIDFASPWSRADGYIEARYKPPKAFHAISSKVPVSFPTRRIKPNAQAFASRQCPTMGSVK